MNKAQTDPGSVSVRPNRKDRLRTHASTAERGEEFLLFRLEDKRHEIRTLLQEIG